RAGGIRDQLVTACGEQLRPLLLHQPSDGGLRHGSPNSRDCRQSMKDVAQGAQPGDQDFCHSPLLNISVVEWSLESPTMATRPPHSITTSRSGTLSTV